MFGVNNNGGIYVNICSVGKLELSSSDCRHVLFKLTW